MKVPGAEWDIRWASVDGPSGYFYYRESDECEVR